MFGAFARNIVRMITVLESRICFSDTFSSLTIWSIFVREAKPQTLHLKEGNAGHWNISMLKLNASFMPFQRKNTKNS